MVKLFGVGNDDDNISEQTVHIPVEQINAEQEDFVEELPVGQIALDVLENHESVYILAPVAGIELHDIDISVHETTLTIS